MFYLSHKPVVRQDAVTTRTVYYASAKRQPLASRQYQPLKTLLGHLPLSDFSHISHERGKIF